MWVEWYVPWMRIITFHNTLGRSEVSEERLESKDFPQPISGTGCQLPEDFPIRGLTWAQKPFPVAFFRHLVTEEDECALELRSHFAHTYTVSKQSRATVGVSSRHCFKTVIL